MEHVAPGGRKEIENQDGNFRFPDVNVMAYYCHCRSVFMSEPLGRFSSMRALMLQQGLSQALKQPMISGSKATKGFLSPSCLFLHIFVLPHYSCSLRSVSHSFSSASALRLLPSFSSRSCGGFHLQCREDHRHRVMSWLLVFLAFACSECWQWWL